METPYGLLVPDKRYAIVRTSGLSLMVSAIASAADVPFTIVRGGEKVRLRLRISSYSHLSGRCDAFDFWGVVHASTGIGVSGRYLNVDEGEGHGHAVFSPRSDRPRPTKRRG